MKNHVWAYLIGIIAASETASRVIAVQSAEDSIRTFVPYTSEGYRFLGLSWLLFFSFSARAGFDAASLSCLRTARQASGHDLGRAVNTVKNTIPHAVGPRAAQHEKAWPDVRSKRVPFVLPDRLKL